MPYHIELQARRSGIANRLVNRKNVVESYIIYTLGEASK